MQRPNSRLVDTVPPIMQTTARELRRLLGLQTTRNPQLERLLLKDPAAAIAAFRALGQIKPNAFETVSDAAHAVSLIGREPLQAVIQSLPTLELDATAQSPRDTAASAYSQAAHAAHYANALATHKKASGNQAISTAALLQQPAILALWADQPESAQRATNAVRDGVPFEQAFAAELGEPVEDVNWRLAEAWSLPLLARQAMADWDDFNARPAMVKLADGLAQTGAAGWRSETREAMTAVLAEHLGCKDDAATTWLHEQAAEAARTLQGLDYPLPGFELLYTDCADDAADDDEHERVPVMGAWRDRMPTSTPSASSKPDLHETMLAMMQRIRHEARTSRVAFAVLDRSRSHLRTRLALGGHADDPVRHLNLDLAEQHLFSLLMRKPQSVWLNRGNAKKYQAYLPPPLQRLFGPQGAYMMSIFANDRPLGLLYADGDALNAEGYERFRVLCREAATILGGQKTAAI